MKLARSLDVVQWGDWGGATFGAFASSSHGEIVVGGDVILVTLRLERDSCCVGTRMLLYYILFGAVV